MTSEPSAEYKDLRDGLEIAVEAHEEAYWNSPNGDRRELEAAKSTRRRKLDEHVAKLEAERDRLRAHIEWTTWLGHGIGKAGGAPTSDEYRAATETGERLLRGDDGE